MTGQALSRFCDAKMGNFPSNPVRTRRISPLNALRPAHGGVHHIAVRACSDTKSVSRHARNLTVDTACGHKIAATK